MKICFLTTANSIHSYKWIGYFSRLGYEIIWFSLEKKLYEIPEHVRYIEITSKYKFFALFKAILTMKKVLKNSPVDFVHVHYLGFYGLMSLFVNEKLMATAWGSDVLINKKNFFKKILIKRVVKKSQLITCDAHHLETVLINNFRAPKNKIHIVNFGIDSKKFSKQPLNDQFKQAIGISSNQTIVKKFSKQPLNDQFKQAIGISSNQTIVSTRGFEEIYDIQTLIKAMPLILENMPKIKLILVGRGTIRPKLEALVKSLKLKDSVFFIGLIPNEELPSLLSNMDVYVSTSLSDAGLASSTAEAMACETPVVVSNSAENDKWIGHNQNGFLFPVKDNKKLAKILIKLLQNEDLRGVIGKEGRKVIVKNNDYENEMNKVSELYKKINI